MSWRGSLISTLARMELGGFRSVYLDVSLLGTTEDANGLIVTDFDAGSQEGEVTVTINAAGQFDGLQEAPHAPLTVAQLATLLGVNVPSFSDGSRVLVVEIEPTAALTRYTFIGLAFLDGAAQATLTGGGVSAWRNAATDNLQPGLHDATIDIIPPGGAVARSTDTGVCGVLKYNSTDATAFSLMCFTYSDAGPHGFTAYEPSISGAPQELAVFAGCNNAAGTGGNAALSARMRIASVLASDFPHALFNAA